MSQGDDMAIPKPRRISSDSQVAKTLAAALRVAAFSWALVRTSLSHVAFIVSLVLLLGCADRNDVMVINQTPNDIVVTGAKRNGKTLSKRELVVPSSAKGYVPVPGYAAFRANSLGFLEIDIRESSGVARTASCRLDRRTSGGCLFKASYVGSEQLKCVCDPYSDFR